MDPVPIPEPPEDQARATVTITSPANGTTLTGPATGAPITVSGTATFLSTSSVTYAVWVQIGSQLPQAATLTPSGTKYAWTYTGPANAPGAVVISATATAGDATDTKSVTVNLPDTVAPSLSILEPAPGQTISLSEAGTLVTLKVRASDYLGLQTVGWRLDGATTYTPITAPDAGDPTSWTAGVPLAVAALGNHTITVRCVDKAGNAVERAVAVVGVDRNPPHFIIGEPNDGQTFIGAPHTVVVKGTAWDVQGGMVGGQAIVESSLDGIEPFARADSTDNWANWTATVSITEYGDHVVHIRFKDRDGNPATRLLKLQVVSAYKPVDAEALLSPRAYLQDLLKFTRDHVAVGGTTPTPVSTATLQAVFRQPFGKLAEPLYELGSQPVNQLRIAIEVLRKLRAPDTDTVWIDDALPPGATAWVTNDAFNWVTANPLPYSGSQAHQSSVFAGVHQHGFNGATTPLAVNPGDLLYAHVYLDPQSLPDEVMLQWFDGSWEHRAYWGVDRTGWGVNGSTSRRYMGALPPAGQWVRLEVPARYVGLEGKAISGMAFTLNNGRATWDRAGKTSGPVMVLPQLAGHWRFNETAGVEALDSSANANHGLVQGATRVAGKLGGALSFDGVANRVVMVNAPFGPDVTNNFTITFWVNPQATHEVDVPSTSGISGTAGQRYAFAPLSGGLYVAAEHAGVGVSVGTNGISVYEHSDNYLPALLVHEAPLSGWTHVAVVYRDRQPRLYVNGVLVKDGLVGPKTYVHAIPDALGGHLYGSFKGQLDDVRVYTVSLSEPSIKALADGQTGDPSTAALAGAEAEYLQTAYEALLVGLGTSYDEIRLAHGAPREAREALAARLGIPLTSSAPDELERLLLGPDTLSEAGLERLFGLVSSVRDPLVMAAPAEVRKWKEDHLDASWLKQDTPGPDSPASPPLIDPDVIGLEDLNASPDNPALLLWQARAAEVAANLAAIKSAREGKPTAAAGFEQVVKDVLGVPPSELVRLADLQKQGTSIASSLTDLGLTPQTLAVLLRIGALAAAGTVTAREWDDVYNILTQVKKTRSHPQWRSAESGGIALMPKFFRVSSAPRTLTPWRATPQARQAWQERLQARLDQKQAVIDAWLAAQDQAEEASLPGLRDALVSALAGRQVADDVADWVSRTFLVDVRVGGSQKTTRVLQALETIQGVMFSLRTSQFDEAHPVRLQKWARVESGGERQFDREWQWMGSYATWRSAMFVFGYPENALLPALRDDATTAFGAFLRAVRENPQLRPDQARKVAADFLASLPATVRAALPPGFVLTDEDMTDAKLRALRATTKDLLGKNDTVWIEDALPPGATPMQAIDTWNWVSANPKPYSGAAAHQSAVFAELHQHHFTGATVPLKVDPGDRLFAMVYLDPANVPEQVMLQWNDGTWEHRAYWGENKISAGYGVDGTSSRYYMGPMPLPGRWVRLEVPASAVALEGRSLNGMAFTLWGGRATWDRAGKTSKYLPELFYFAPMQLALALQKSGEYVAALDWYQTVYASDLPLGERKVYYGLEVESSLTADFDRTAHWVRHQLNPHQVAAVRPSSYTRFTLMSIVRCCTEFADAEFTRDTGESLARARALYLTARGLLALPEMRPTVAPAGISPFPPNPVLEALRVRVEVQLFKLRTGRNIAGMSRQVESRPPSVAQIGAGVVSGSTAVPGAPSSGLLQPTPYRYAVLIERSKQLVGLAQQIEAAYLHALEQFDAAGYRRAQADQGLELASAGVELQNRRVTEAGRGVSLATQQKARVSWQVGALDRLIGAGLSDYENRMIADYSLMESARNLLAGADAAAAITQAFATVSSNTLGWVTGGAAIPAVALTNLAKLGATTWVNAVERQIQQDTLRASQERREQEWQFQRGLAMQDELIGAAQIEMAKDHKAVTEQELAIATAQEKHARAMVTFLDGQFTNAELYQWMSGVLAGVYSYFLQHATATAKLAQNQLAFERQEVPTAFIQNDYWQAPSADSAADSPNAAAPDRKGLTGSARLLQDIYQLDQYAFDTNKRKLQLAQTFSLARLAPLEFQEFRETGVVRFGTPMALFDQGFPGHYLRLIRRVRTSVVALIPPSQGIRASLVASGISRVVVGGATFQEVPIRRDPELVALTSPANATGLFDLDVQSDMLLPFEGMGVDTSWELQMPKAANPFDYRTIADVLVTIEYTALNSFDYRRQVIQRLSADVSSDRVCSFRAQLADQWYELHNPDQSATPMVVRFSTSRDDFPPNVGDLKIQQVLLAFTRSPGGHPTAVHVDHLRFVQAGQTTTVGATTTVDGMISTRKGTGSAWIPLIGQPPLGEWELALTDSAALRTAFENDDIDDILFVITYSGHTPDWPL